MKILGTGLSGLVGSRIVELLNSEFEFEDVSLDTGINIVNKDQVSQAIKNSSSSVVLHLAAKADVDSCEQDKPLGKEGPAWKINVLGTENVVNACKESGKKIIYISTDFVFDGEKEYYTEEDTPNPLNWYAQTKYEGEKIVQQSLGPYIVMRIAYPYRKGVFAKKDFVHSILNRLEKGQMVKAVVDHVITPTFIDDIAKAIKFLIEKKEEGIFHVVGSEHITPFDASLKIATQFGFDLSLIGKTTRSEYFKDRAQRPFRLALKNDKILQLGLQMKTFEEGLREIS